MSRPARPARPAARRPVSRNTAAGAALLALFGAALLIPAPEAQARPKHLGIFGKLYEKELDKKVIDGSKCNVCHEKTQKSKKFRNPYGLELSKLMEKNEKDEKKVIEALEKAAAMKSCVEGKTYGDLIKDGKLPAEECPPVEDEDGLNLVPVPDPNM